MPGTIKVFGWKVILDRVSFKVNLENRGVTVSCNFCLLCKTIHYVKRRWKHDIANHFCSFYINGLSKKLSVFEEEGCD